jgi:hypothetical protein
MQDLPVEEEIVVDDDEDEDDDVISIYSSEGEEDETVNLDHFSALHLQITVGPEGRSVSGLTG